MSISSTVKTVMPYLKTASGYVLHRLSSQGVEMNDGTTLEQKVTSLNNLISQKVDSSDVVNNCLTTESGFVLDARQGKALDDKITELNGKLQDSGWIEMTSSISFAYKPKFRKIGKTVYVMGTIRYSDNGIFRNDEIIGDIPSEFIPSSFYGTYECIIPFAFISGNGSRERMYIRGNHVYFAGTSNARDGILAASCYLTD